MVESVLATRSACGTAKAGNPIMLRIAASVSLELDSLGSIDSRTAAHLTASSGRTWISEGGPPRPPNRSN